MGLDTASVKFLCFAKALGVDFVRTATIGRQSFFPDSATLRRVFSALGISQNVEDFLRQNAYADQFFTLLGANEITSVDYSSYEGASIVHDLNLPIPDDLRERFSVVHDGGTIEHVFNAPQAFKNCMEMVEVGGHFTQVNEANNFMGHGFWQFSPELLFRIFSPANGFHVKSILLHEVKRGGAWYRVADPDMVQSRVELCNDTPTYILTVAKRISKAEIFTPPPLQSDYVASWSRAENAPRSAAVVPDGATWRRFVPTPVKRAKRALTGILKPKQLRLSFNQPCFSRVDEDALICGKLT